MANLPIWAILARLPLCDDLVELVVHHVNLFHRAATQIQAAARGFLVRDGPPPLLDFWPGGLIIVDEYLTFDTTHHGHAILFPHALENHTNLSVHGVASSFLTMNLYEDYEEVD